MTPSNQKLLCSIPLFSGCTTLQLDGLAPFIENVGVRRHQEIYREGAPSRHFHLVVKGEVCLEKERGPGAEPMRLAIVRPGEGFGLGEVMLAHYYTTATALADGQLLRIENRIFRRHFLAVASVREQVMTALSEIARFLLFSVAAGSGVTMLAIYLRHLCRESGQEAGGKIHVRTRVVQPQIASLLNMSREHVTRLFAQLRKRGVVQFNRGYPIIDRRWLTETITDPDLADVMVYRDYPRCHP